MKIKLEDLLKIQHPDQTKVKFNMNASDPRKKALDFLLEDSEEWLIMNEWKTTQSSNNMGERSYLISFAQYYPYGLEFFLFGGIYKVELREESNTNKEYEKRLIVKLDKPGEVLKSYGIDQYSELIGMTENITLNEKGLQAIQNYKRNERQILSAFIISFVSLIVSIIGIFIKVSK